MNSKRPRFLSLMADGGTDVSTKELELIYVRYLDQGSVVNKFLKVHELKDATADGIISTIGEAIEQAGVNDWKQALVHMGTDGASVYTGRHNGVVAKLTQEIPWLTGIHCVADNLELAALDALKTESAVGEVKEMLKGIYKHYKYSPKALREVREVASVLEEDFILPVNILGTRWLPHMQRELTALLRNYQAIIAHFNDTAADRRGSADMQGRATNIVRKLENLFTVGFIHLMLDFIEVLSKVSLLFRRNDMTLAAAKDGLEVARLELKAMVARPARKFSEFLNAARLDQSYKGVELRSRPDDLERLADKRRHLAASIEEYIDGRFESLVDNPVLSAAEIFDVKNWPQNNTELATYGEDQIEILKTHYQPLLQLNNCNLDALSDEWMELKAVVSRNHGYRNMKHNALWENVFADHGLTLQNILMLVEIILILPVSTACCERGFSCVKRIKSNLRSTLTTETLDVLVRISLDGRSLEKFDPMPAVKHWWEAGERSRRPGFRPH